MELSYGNIWAAVARAVPDRLAVAGAGHSLTYGELTAQAGSLCTVLAEHGIGHGDRLVIVSHNRPEYLVTLMSCFLMGVTPVPMNFRYRATELDPLLADCGASAVLYTASVEEQVQALDAPSVRLWLRIDDVAPSRPPRSGGVSWDQVTTAPSALPAVGPDDGELLVYTGGTTGRPKGVVWGLEELLAVQMYSTYDTLAVAHPATLEEAVAIAVDPDVPHEVVLPLAPLMHGTALFNSMNALLTGGSVVMLSSARFDAEEACRLIAHHGVARLIVAGDAVALPLIEGALQAQADWSSVTTIISSGMRFSDEVKARMHSLTDLTIVDLLASSEGGPYAVATSTSAEDLPAELTLFPGGVVLDDRDREVQDVPGATGVLAYGGQLPKGYYGDPEKTAETFRVLDGRRYVAAGDLVNVLGDGRIQLLGRGSSVVNTGGEKVFPAEVEEALLDHPAVEDAAVFGIPDPRFGEAVVAAVALHEGLTADEEELSTFVGARLAGYKKPRKILIRSSLDRSPSGKLSMAKLKQAVMLNDGVGA